MHHANLLIGSKEWALSQIPESDRMEGPDVIVSHYDRMNIANVRTLIYEAGLRPVVREYRSFVLVCDSLLHEAQNALLKLIEEPNVHTVFYLILPREDILLPTLHSRFHTFAVEGEKSTQKIFDAFVKLSYANRLKYIGERLTVEDSAWITEFLYGLELYSKVKHDPRLMKEVIMLMSYIHTAGASKKMLLEHMALTL